MFTSNVFIEPTKDQWPQLCSRAPQAMEQLEDYVQEMMQQVKLGGDAAIKTYRQQFDAVSPDVALVIYAEAINKGAQALSAPLKAAINLAYSNIRRFHEAQVQEERSIETTAGVHCWRKSIPINPVGLYIPGGSAPLFSTLLMLGIPARIAGCTELVVCSPPRKDGTLDPSILYTASLLGIEKIICAGGPAAIAAMGYGTESIPKVNKIFGPGNQYVTCAKQLLSTAGVAIDMPAGPSELLVYADKTFVPEFVAADLLSQAEHGTDSQVILVAVDVSILQAVEKALQQQLLMLPRRQIAADALTHCRFIQIKEVQNAFDFINEYAPEHLVIASSRAGSYAHLVQNAGSVFLGNYTPEAAGDYASGTNHTLPTNGYAKAFSGVSVDSFLKKISFQEINALGIKNIGPAVEWMAQAEGLFAHKNAVTLRLENL